MRRITSINNIIGLTTLLLLLSFSYQKSQAGKIQVQWEDELKGDFSFTSDWSYAENIFVSQPHGELVCDGWCPEGVEEMRLKDGRIDPKQKNAYYALVDTTHRFHSFEGKAVSYEYGGTHFATCKQDEEGKIVVETEANVGTHCSLIIPIEGDNCIPKIHFVSIRNIPEVYYPCNGGWITVSRSHWKKDIFRAQFHFTFWDEENGKELMWEGKIHTPIQP